MKQSVSVKDCFIAPLFHCFTPPNPVAKGFTLIEVLLSIAAITIIAGFSVPVYQSFQVRNDLDVAATTIALSARRAEMLAQGSDGDTSWGVHVAPDGIVLYKGSGFANRDVSVDETFEMPKSITASGTTEFIFAKFTGLPSSSSTLLLTSSNNETRTITINAKGMVNY
jgi:prepilin-type N-terminal cleavage/methylation domain-containing protein